MSSEDDFERQVRFLERELATTRETLRDRFAMAALAGVIGDFGGFSECRESISAAAYKIADAMLEARKS